MQQLIIVRHGEYEESTREKRLTDAGRVQMVEMGDRLARFMLGARVVILTSPTRRAYEGAFIIGNMLGLTPEVCDLLSEDTSYKTYYPQMLEELRTKMHADGNPIHVFILVTHLPYAVEFPGYFIEHELGRVAPENLSIKKGEGCLVNCLDGTTSRV